MTNSPAGINEVGTVYLPVADQERALAFYVGKLGFEKRLDFEYGGGHRWIEVAPDGARHRLALVPSGEGTSAGGDVTRCAFETGDVETAHEALRARGVDVDDAIAGTGSSRPGLVSPELRIVDPVPAQFYLRDPDGNRFLIVEAG